MSEKAEEVFVSDGDVQYLEAVEKKPFDPLGPLYTSIYEGLLVRGLVRRSPVGYVLSPSGSKTLEAWRRRP